MKKSLATPPPAYAWNVKRAQCRGVSVHDRFISFLLDLTALRALAVPLKKLVALYVLLGRNLWLLAGEVVRLLLFDTVGWLHGFPRGIKSLRRWHMALAFALVASAVHTGVVKYRDMYDDEFRRRRQLQAEMQQANSYEEWAVAASQLNELEGQDSPAETARWKREARLYDRKLLKKRSKHLHAVRKQGDISEVMFAVRADLLRNLGNMANSELHERIAVVPDAIKDYITEVKLHLEAITAFEGPELSLEEKLAFMRETRHAFGRTALVLSGGGALGAFHVGVVKALFEAQLLPRVLAGSSVGSIVAATVATRDDAELAALFSSSDNFDLSFFSNSTASEFLQHFLKNGTLQDGSILAQRLKRLLGTLTFLQAFQHSGRILNVAVCPADTNEPPRVLNYLTAPHVFVWSAVACSSAFPFLYAPQNLMQRNARGEEVPFSAEAMRESLRRWRDGSLEEDLPMRSLSEMFGVNYFLVSQTNPHIVPALNLKKRVPRQLGAVLELEWKHRCQQLQALFPGLRWLKVFSQPWEGDVTMVLPSTYMQIKKSITNPSQEDLRLACRQGELVTWEKLSAIQANCGIEVQLDACMLRLTEEAVARRQLGVVPPLRPQGRMKTRTPSWINLHAMGLPSSASEEGPMAHSPHMGTTSLAMRARAGGEALAMSPVTSSVLTRNGLLHGSTALGSVREHEGGSSSSSSASSRDSEDTSGRSSLDLHLSLGHAHSTSHVTLDAIDLPPARTRLSKTFNPRRSSHDMFDDLVRCKVSGDVATDCTDRSVNLWEALVPLASTTMMTPRGSNIPRPISDQALDVAQY